MAQPIANPTAQLTLFRAALGRIGFDPDGQSALIEHGFTSMYNMMIYSKEQIKRVCTVLRERPLNPLVITIEQEQLLTTMQNWVKTRVRLNQNIDPQLFTRDVAIAEAIKMVNIAEESINDKESDVKLPDKFKLSTKWVIFAEAIDTYLNRLKGQGRVPLNYVIRDLVAPIPGTVFATEQEHAVAAAPLNGFQYDLDNERVYGIVKQLILEGPAWAYITSTIDRAKDGRGAWLALRAHYEGESFLTKQKEEAYKCLETVHYKGERATFTFEHFTGLLTKAYNDLQRYGEPILESKKVRDLLAKITDPKLESAKQAIRITSTYKNDFSMAVNFLAESVETFDRVKTRTISHISQSSTSANSNRGRFRRSGRFTTHTAEQHGGRGRGGRGNYRGRGRGARGRNANHNTTTTTYIPPSEWNAMTSEQRQSFLQARATSRIHAIASSLIPDDISAVTNTTGISTTNAPNIQQIAPMYTMPPPPPVGPTSVTGNTTIATLSSTPFGGRPAHRGRS
jgi:hypothetical protein